MRHLIALALLATLAGRVAHADELADVKARGTLICGTLGTAEPFSFPDPKTREIVGYDVDICGKVAQALGVKLQMKPMSVDARIPELTQGRVDILAANLGWSKARAEQIDYSDAYFVSAQKIMVTAGSGITTLAGLDGKRVSAIEGSSSADGVRRVLPKAETVTYQDTSAAFLALVQGKVDGFCASELLLVKLRKKVEATTKLTIIAQPVFVEDWGLGIRKGEPAFKAAVDKALMGLESSGEAATLFNKWFGPQTPYDMKRDFTIAPIKG